MTKAEMVETLYDEFKTLHYCMQYYANADNPLHDLRKSRDFDMRACEVCDMAEALFQVDLFSRYLDELDEQLELNRYLDELE